MKSRQILVSLALAASFAHAQPAGGPIPQPAQVVNLLNLDSGRAGKVEAVLANAQERMTNARQQIGAPTDKTTRSTLHAAVRAIREDTDRQLAEILTAEEMAKVKDALPRPQRGEGGKRRGT